MKSPTDSKPDSLIADIDEALLLNGVSATRFGYAVAGDPALVAKLRKGRKPRSPMRAAIRTALDRLAQGEEI